MTIRSKLLISAATVLAATIFMMAVHYWDRYSEEYYETRVELANAQLQATLELEVAANRHLKEVSDVLLLGEEEEGKELDEAGARVDAAFRRAEELLVEEAAFLLESDEDEEERFARLRVLYAEINEEIDVIAGLLRKGQSTEATEHLEEVIERKFDEDFVGLIGEAVADEQDELEEAKRSCDVACERIVMFEICLWAAMVLIVLGLLFMLQRSIGGTLKRLVRGTELVGGGMLEHRIGIKTKDEFGRLAGAFDRMVENLQYSGKALRASEAEHRMLLENLPQKIFYKNKDSVYVSCNDNMANDLGITAEEIAGKTDYDFFSNELAEKYRADDRRLMECGITEEIEEKYTKDGQELIVQTVKTPIRDDEGNVIGILGIFWDITDRKQAEEEREKLLHDMGERIKELKCMYGVANVVRERETMEEVFRDVVALIPPSWQYPEITRAKVRFDGKEYISEPFEETEWNQTSDIIVGGEPHGAVEVYRLEERPRLDEGPFLKEERHLIDGISRTLGEAADRKRAERTLHDSERRFRTITASALDAIVMMDPEGKISFWNEAAERIFGWSRDEMIGKELHPILAPAEYHSAYRKGFEEFRRTGKGAAVGKVLELSAVRKDGTEFPIEISVAAVKLGGHWNAVGVIRDITERKRMEEELHAAKEVAEAAAQAKSQFLANMSHEIRTPMNGVIGMTGLLLDTGLDEEQREYAETVRTSGESLLRVINEILDYSKIEAGKLDLELIDFDLRTAIEEALDILSARTYEKGLEFACLIHHDVPSFVRGDPGRLRQILINLAGNAIKFTEKGEVVIRAMLEEETETRAKVRFTVTDTGIGIPQDRIGILFQSFSQADASATRRHGGTGLGLAISKQLTEMMDGEIGVQSEEGKGSTFWFTTVFERQPEDQQPELLVPEDIRDKRFLAVDDNATSRYVLGQQLRAWNCRFDEASSGAEALDKLRQAVAEGDPFDLAILDMVMPEMDGETLGRVIKEDPDLKNTVLVILSSVGRRGDAERFHEIGFAAYLTKPVKQSQLYDCLTTVIGERATAEGTRPVSLVTRHSLAESKKRRLRILLAEDNVINQKVALKILEKLGYRADVVASGEEAVAVLDTVPYDLVLMDVQMPEMDGFEATRRIRSTQTSALNPKIPIIAMTAHAMKGDRERCLEAGMNDYVTKPVDPQQLAETIERFSPGSTPRRTKDPHDKGSPEKEIFDKAALLERLDGDEDACKELVDLFIEDLPQQLDQLRQALDEKAHERVKRQAHTIKGAAANIGALALSDAAFQIETAGKKQNLDQARSLIENLKGEFERLKKALSP